MSSRPRLNAFLYVLEHFSCEEENERQIALALLNRLEFSVIPIRSFDCSKCVAAQQVYCILHSNAYLNTSTI